MFNLNDGHGLFTKVAAKILADYEASAVKPGPEVVAPPQLVEAVDQFLAVFKKLDADHGGTGPLPYDDASQLLDYVLSCLIDLGAWAERLGTAESRRSLGRVALSVADWAIRHRGEIRTLEPLVDACATEANNTDSIDTLKSLFYVLQQLIAHVSPAIRADLNKYDQTRPWRVLNFNFAIVATRTQNLDLMTQAFDALGTNLPDDAPLFFEEGIKQAQKTVYGPEVKSLMQDYFDRWTVKH